MLKEIYEITPELEECAGGAGSAQGTGGMKTKLDAAKVAIDAGVGMVLANGKDPGILIDIIQGEEIGTLFINKKGE
jgi:glutamate 5-kinase